MAFIMKVGNTNISHYIATDGFQWSKNDIDASGSGRSKNGTMRRKRVASKAKLQVSCRPLNESELSALISLISPETVSVTYRNPATASNRTATFYGSSVKAGVVQDMGTTVLYKGIAFDLIEV